MNRCTSTWADMPETMTLDELLHHPLYKNCPDNGYIWQVLLTNGVLYTGRVGSEIGQKCPPDAVLDPIMMGRG